jgi:hypothetical protein
MDDMELNSSPLSARAGQRPTQPLSPWGVGDGGGGRVHLDSKCTPSFVQFVKAKEATIDIGQM